MSGGTTIIAVGGATIPSSGIFASQGLSTVAQLLAGDLANAPQDIVIYNPKTGIVPTVPSAQTNQYVLVIPNNVAAGSLRLPSGYGAVLLGEGSSATVTGGGSHTTVVSAGTLNYTGGAAEIVATSTVPGTTGTYTDNLTGAIFELSGGSYSVLAAGNKQVINVDKGTNTTIVATGNNDQIQLGAPSGAAPPAQLTAAAGAVTVAAGANTLTLTGGADAVTINGANNLIVDSGGGSTTLTGASGSSTIFAAANDIYYGAGATTEFLSSSGAQTVFGGIGNDTVFNTLGGNVLYLEGSGSNNTFVGGTGNSTIFGGGSGAVFGGTGATSLVLGSSTDIFVGGGGADSIYGGSLQATVFGTNNENASVIGTRSAIEVALGANSSYNASLSNGGNAFFALSSTGNTTLAGAASSAPVGDNFVLDNTGGTNDHTITIQNWHTGDGFFAANYSQVDIQTMDSAIAGGANTFKLSDGTTVVFQGQQPTHASGNALF